MRYEEYVNGQGPTCTSCRIYAFEEQYGARQCSRKASPAGSRVVATSRLAGLSRPINDSYMINQSNTTKAEQ